MWTGWPTPASRSYEVMPMKYPNLEALLMQDMAAQRYFNRLPDYVQSQIVTRAGSINSFASLQDYAENLTRGDN